MPGMPVSRLYSFVQGEPLLDWIELVAKDRGFIRDDEAEGYLEATDYGAFMRAKGQEFERRIVGLIGQQTEVVAIEGAAGNTDAAYAATERALAEGCDAICQGLLRDEQRGLFGAADLIIKAAALERIVPGTFPEGPPEAYVLVDIKFKTLSLNKGGDVASTHRWEKVQLSLYESMLAKMLGRDPQPAFVLGRQWKSKHGMGRSAFDRLGMVKTEDSKIWSQIEEGLQWLKELDSDGHKWHAIPEPSRDELRAKKPGDKDGAWHTEKRRIYEAQNPIPEDMPDFSPARINSGTEEWRSASGLELYVDFETFNNSNDPFDELPQVGGQAMIFMIGLGWAVDGDFDFQVFTAKAESLEGEREMMDEWFAMMADLKQRHASGQERVPVYHWHSHEVTELAKARGRHADAEWPDLDWFDLLHKLYRPAEIKIKGARGGSLKEVAKALYAQYKIKTVWEDGPGDGLVAMTGAWSAYQAAQEGVISEAILPGMDEPLMPLIEQYNKVDVKVMWEILTYLREHH